MKAYQGGPVPGQSEPSSPLGSLINHALIPSRSFRTEEPCVGGGAVHGHSGGRVCFSLGEGRKAETLAGVQCGCRDSEREAGHFKCFTSLVS